MGYITEKEVYQLIGEALQVDISDINANTSKDDIESWDSLGHLNILVRLDSKLEGKPSDINELADATSVNSIVEILKENNLLI
jgi:acyl carrier protein